MTNSVVNGGIKWDISLLVIAPAVDVMKSFRGKNRKNFCGKMRVGTGAQNASRVSKKRFNFRFRTEIYFAVIVLTGYVLESIIGWMYGISGWYANIVGTIVGVALVLRALIYVVRSIMNELDE